MTSVYVAPETWKWLYISMVYDNALAIEVSVKTGLRINDVLSIKKTDLVETGNRRYLRKVAQKTGKKVSKQIENELYNRLIKNAGNDEYCFPSKSKTGHRGRTAVYKDLKKACEKAGLDPRGLSPHSARKTYAVELYHDKGIEECQRELQHEKQYITLLYAMSDIIKDKKRESAEKYAEKSVSSKKVIDEIIKEVSKGLETEIKRIVKEAVTGI